MHKKPILHAGISFRAIKRVLELMVKNLPSIKLYMLYQTLKSYHIDSTMNSSFQGNNTFTGKVLKAFYNRSIYSLPFG